MNTDQILLRNDNEEDSEYNSDDNLKIVTESPNAKRKPSPRPSKSEKLIIQSIEDELQRRLEEKAAKTHLNAKHVKNIIKHVVTNEHVLALVKKAENPTGCNDSIPYEPKLTRAKAKELLSSVPVAAMPWATPKPSSEVQVLFSEDLQEDSSGDEYIPTAEESEDDREGSIFSDPPSIPPATPPSIPTNIDSSTQTNWTDDGVFKIPPVKSQESTEEEANIALRTRSKLCLSSTPLEVIEEAFIPPDITTDMYDMYCDNDDWMDFLKKFTRPLDEVAKPTEDEEQDPEYNILADEEMDEIDKEELRVDKAVKVTKKELNNLIAELFDSSELCMINNAIETEKNDQSVVTCQAEDVNCTEKLKDVPDGSEQTAGVPQENVVVVVEEANISQDEENIYINRNQVPLIEQQLRQHVQLLTQNFILTYQHPELHDNSIQSKEYLMNLKFLCEGKQRSMFFAVNLFKAIELVEYWESLLATNNDEVKNMKRHIKKTMDECIRNKSTGNQYLPTFPELILKTISNSDVFLYPSLLPKIPFKPNSLFPKYQVYTDSEDQLIALGLEQFQALLSKNRKNISRNGDVKLRMLTSFIEEYIMPLKNSRKIYEHINILRRPRCGSNPIKYYFQHKRAPASLHYVCPIEELQILPPCRRPPEQLPHQWRMFNFPNSEANVVKNETEVQVVQSIIEIKYVNPAIKSSPVVVNIEKPILPKGPIPSPVHTNRRRTIVPFRRRQLRIQERTRYKFKDPISKFVECLSRPSVINDLIKLYSDSGDIQRHSDIISRSVLDTMLPSMPSLGTPVKNCSQNEVQNENDVNGARKENKKSVLPDISMINSSNFQLPDTNTEVEFCRSTENCQTVTTTCITETSAVSENVLNSAGEERQDETNTTLPQKDNSEVASAAVKPAAKKEPSGAEKKRAKLRKEFLANLTLSAPEDPKVEKQKSEMFALAYYDKMRETLELEDYHKVMQILNDHEEGDAVDLYNKIKKVLSPKYEELADEFLLFLREKEAAAVGQLIPWITMNNRSKFLRKLELYFKDQPAQLRKIFNCLTELSQTVNVSMEKIKNTLVPMFKGNAILSDLFFQNFLNERPPTSLLEGPYETIDVMNDNPDDEEVFETITIPDTVDKYGGPSCICNCHQIEDPEFKSRYRHCIRCGTRFINGRVFIQSGRGLRPATVSFNSSSNEEHNARLVGKVPICSKKKRSETSPSKQVMLSPTKENADEETEDETDGKKKSKRKSPSKKKASAKTSKDSKESPQKSAKNSKTASGNGKFSNTSPTVKSNRKRSYSVRKKVSDKKADKLTDEKATVKPGATPGQQKRLADESIEWEEQPNVISMELKANSPGQQTAESESEFCEESSQDNCESDSNSSMSSINNHSQSDSNTEECSWKREEDKIILETFQKENDKEHAFKIIADQLKNRTVSQISNRFQTLMALLLETLGNS